MFKRDYRTVWQREDDNKAVAALDAINVQRPEDHDLADEILLSRVHPDVADAYRRVLARTPIRVSVWMGS